MPYVEILAPRATDAGKQAAAGAVTDGIVAGFDVPASTVTIYFVPHADGCYAHAGRLGAEPGEGRILVKVHAYRRTLAARRAVAAAMTPAIAACFDTDSRNVAIYFMDRERDEVAHDGRITGDEDSLTSPTP